MFMIAFRAPLCVPFRAKSSGAAAEELEHKILSTFRHWEALKFCISEKFDIRIWSSSWKCSNNTVMLHHPIFGNFLDNCEIHQQFC